MRARWPLLFLPLVLGAPAPTQAHDARGNEDARSARAALQAGEIRPLSELLTTVESRYDGRVIETELEREHGRWVYEFKLLPPAGHLFMLTIDAATGQVIGSRGPVREKR
ncbi:MAG: PepSY domain-containing protein [Rhodospirillales bacterium]|nr:PepSY domain-containing protein [Rhodospirillales bacterium]MBN8897128.1 PepSY domain-containing protein [Rhodospirillales bacterium]